MNNREREREGWECSKSEGERGRDHERDQERDQGRGSRGGRVPGRRNGKLGTTSQVFPQHKRVRIDETRM